MSATQTTPSTPTALKTVLEARLASVHVSLPGIVVSYDRAKQTADVQPAVNKLVPSAEDEELDISKRYPVIPAVPVCWPRGGGFFVAADLEPGDAVTLLFSEADYSGWRNSGTVSDPEDKRMHHLSHAIAIPGLFERGAEISGLGAGLTLGSMSGHRVVHTSTQTEVGGSSVAVALATKLDLIFKAISGLTTATNPATVITLANGILLAVRAAYPGADGAPNLLDTAGSDRLKVGG